MCRLSRRTTIESIAAESIVSSAGHSPRAAPAVPDAKQGKPADVAAERLRAKQLSGPLSPPGSTPPALLLYELRKVLYRHKFIANVWMALPSLRRAHFEAPPGKLDSTGLVDILNLFGPHLVTP